MIVTVRKAPFRLVLREGRPIVLEVSIRNNASKERKYVVTVEVGKELSLAPSGLAKVDTKKTAKVFPGEKVTVAFKVYPRVTTKPGFYPVQVTVDECVDDYDHVVATKEVSVSVPVI